MIEHIGSALSAFETASGVSHHRMSLLIRTIIFGLTLMWGCWCVMGLIHHAKHHDVSESEFASKLFRILIVVCVIWSLVFVA